MSIRVPCPSCAKVYNLDDSMAGKKVRCRECQTPIDVPTAARPERREESRPRDDRLAPTPPSRGAGAVSRRDDDDEPRRRADARSRDREREEEPARGRRPDRSRREDAPPKSNLVPILIGGGVAAVLFIGVAIGGLVYLFSGPSSGTTQTTSNFPPPETIAPPIIQQKPPVVAPPEIPVPAGPVPSEMAADVVQQVKQATAYLRVHLPNGGVSQGSGFFALERGIVITNAHVLGMLRADSLAPRNVDVVIASGEPGETKRTGTVLGVDRNNDLAVLRVGGDLSRLPSPLPVDTATKLTETQKVYIFGFPFGEQLGKNITVSPSTITSLRKDDTGALKQLQVNGGMHPGNSGGPVTDARGVVVGVSVAVIVGTQINFAIPGDFVKQVVDGKIAKTEMGYAYRSDGAARLPVTLTCLDPMNRVRQVKVDVWTGPAGAALPPSATQPAGRPGDGPRQSFTLTVKDGRYVGDLALPAAAAGGVVWMQPMLVNGAGASQWDTSVAVPAEAQNPLERRAVAIQFKAPAGPIERTLKLNNHKKYTLFKGKNSATFEDKMQGNAVEALQPEPGKGTRVRLILGDCPYSSQFGEKIMSPPQQARDLLRKFTATFILTPTHACDRATKSNFRNLRSPYKDAVSEMYEAVCNAYEGTILPVPNREVKPQETWLAKIPLFVRNGPRIMVQHVHLTCTYEGVSTAGGRNEACISLKGRVKGIGKLANVEFGKVSGNAHFDVDAGYVSRVTLTTVTELANEENELGILVQAESTVVRTEGNSLGLTPPPVGPIVKAPDTPMPMVPGGPLQKDLAALKGTWQSGNVNADGGGATGTIKLQLQPASGVGGKGRLEIATKRAGRTTSSTRNFTFSLSQRGDTRVLVAPGLRGTGLAFTYTIDGDQLVLSGKVVSRIAGYTLTNVPLKRTSTNAGDLPAGDPTKVGGKSSADAIKLTGDVFAFVQSAVTENRLADVDVRGFQLSKVRYRDVPAEGGVLIGFQVGLGKFGANDTIASVRPIFSTKAGEKLGAWQGKAPAVPTTVKAKEGYVVSGMLVRTGLGLDALTLIYAKLGKEGLDLTDTYNSETVGGPGGTLNAIGGKGQLFVGVTGHLGGNKSPSSLGLVAVLPKE